MDTKRHIIIIYSMASIIVCVSVFNLYRGMKFNRVTAHIADLKQLEMSHKSKISLWRDSVDKRFLLLNKTDQEIENFLNFLNKGKEDQQRSMEKFTETLLKHKNRIDYLYNKN